MDEYEQHLREHLARLHQEFNRLSKPIIDELVRIEAMKPARHVMVIPADAVQWIPTASLIGDL